MKKKKTQKRKWVIAGTVFSLYTVLVLAGIANQEAVIVHAAPANDEASPSPSPSPTSEDKSGAIPGTAPGCSHSYEWESVSEATETTDGIMALICTACGSVADYQSGFGQGSSFAMFNNKVIDMVKNAKEGETLVVETGLWNSFSQNVMEIIAARRDITIELRYKFEGAWYSIIIPAGVEVPADVPFAGFPGYLTGLYGRSEIVIW